MITEIADILIDPACSAEFETAIRQAVPLFRTASGCRAMALERGLEEAGRYSLIVHWDSLEDHMIHFRQSAAFQEWRLLVGPYFSRPPDVRHFEPAIFGF